MNKLCCKINPMFSCRACGMTVCGTCYDIGCGSGLPKVEREAEQYMTFAYNVEYHEQGNQCPSGANTWLNEPDTTNTLVFGIKETL